MKINKVLLIGIAAAFVGLGSCSDDYDERFDKLEQQLQDVISQVQGAAELSTAIDALETQLGSLQSAVGQLPDGAALSSGLSSLEAEITALEAELAALGESQATSEELELLVSGLTSDLGLLQSDLDELLASSNVLSGDLIIFDQNSLDAALSLGDRVAIVNGKLHIVADDLEAAALNELTSKIVAVTADVKVQTDKVLDFSKLESVGDDIAIAGNTVDLSGLRAVGDDMELAYDGDYDFPELLFVGDTIRLGVEESIGPGKNASAGKAVPRIINFRKVKAAGVEVLYGAEMELSSGVYDMDLDWNDRDDDLYFSNATSIIFGDVPVSFVVAPMASNIELHFEGDLDNRLLIISTATTITAKVSDMDGGLIMSYPFGEDEEVDIEVVLYAFGEGFDSDFVNIWESPADWVSQINLPNLKAVNYDMILLSNTLSMPMLEEFDIEDDGYDLVLAQENISLPNLTVEGDLYLLGATKTMEFASISDAFIQDATGITSLRANAQRNDITYETIGIYQWDALTTVRIFGATDLEEGITIGFDGEDEVFEFLPVMETLELGGLISRANVYFFDALTTIITSGNINDLYIHHNDALVTLTLGHRHITGLDGASLEVGDNDALESLVTLNLDYVYSLYVYDNDSLSSMDFSSMKTAINDEAAVDISIGDNDLSGSYEEYVAQSGTTPEKLGILNTTDLYSLKAFVEALIDSDLVYDVNIRVDNVEDWDGDDYGEFNIVFDEDTDEEDVESWSSEEGVINFNYFWEL